MDAKIREHMIRYAADRAHRIACGCSTNGPPPEIVEIAARVIEFSEDRIRIDERKGIATWLREIADDIESGEYGK